MGCFGSWAQGFVVFGVEGEVDGIRLGACGPSFQLEGTGKHRSPNDY